MNTPSIVWLKNGRLLKQVEDTIQVVDKLPKRVYILKFDPKSNEIFLEDYADEFYFDYKVYNVESKLIDHIIRTFNNTTSNLGVLFNGVKGTGKTVTAKVIANKTNLPVILINSPYPGLSEFISKINSSCVLFFDEFEKNFIRDEGDDVEILSIMDGVFNNCHRRIFLLTTNKLKINDNFIGRPSRIRYKKTFGNLSTDVIMEYLKDNLEDKTKTSEILSFIDSLAISTIDILRNIVEEINIHKCSVDEFKDFINVEFAGYIYPTKYSFYSICEKDYLSKFRKLLNKVETIEKNEDEYKYDLFSESIKIYSPIESLKIGDSFSYYGIIVKPITNDGIIITRDEEKMYCFKILDSGQKLSLYGDKLSFNKIK